MILRSGRVITMLWCNALSRSVATEQVTTPALAVISIIIILLRVGKAFPPLVDLRRVVLIFFVLNESKHTVIIPAVNITQRQPLTSPPHVHSLPLETTEHYRLFRRFRHTMKISAGGDYYQPYWLPFGWKLPFEIFGPFVGCAPGRPSLPDNEPAASAEMWAACERIIEVAGTARGSSAVAARS